MKQISPMLSLVGAAMGGVIGGVLTFCIIDVIRKRKMLITLLLKRRKESLISIASQLVNQSKFLSLSYPYIKCRNCTEGENTLYKWLLEANETEKFETAYFEIHRRKVMIGLILEPEEIRKSELKYINKKQIKKSRCLRKKYAPSFKSYISIDSANEVEDIAQLIQLSWDKALKS
ncbi:MAG: hypothetical protein OXC61_03035 [Flavobacteriaceae bacterium]|nr:hypothetical protein [Flavobacteriaceae bacterium]